MGVCLVTHQIKELSVAIFLQTCWSLGVTTCKKDSHGCEIAQNSGNFNNFYSPNFHLDLQTLSKFNYFCWKILIEKAFEMKRGAFSDKLIQKVGLLTGYIILAKGVY